MPFDGNSWSANRLVPQVGVGNGKKWHPFILLICKNWKKGCNETIRKDRFWRVFWLFFWPFFCLDSMNLMCLVFVAWLNGNQELGSYFSNPQTDQTREGNRWMLDCCLQQADFRTFLYMFVDWMFHAFQFHDIPCIPICNFRLVALLLPVIQMRG